MRLKHFTETWIFVLCIRSNTHTCTKNAHAKSCPKKREERSWFGGEWVSCVCKQTHFMGISLNNYHNSNSSLHNVRTKHPTTPARQWVSLGVRKGERARATDKRTVYSNCMRNRICYTDTGTRAHMWCIEVNTHIHKETNTLLDDDEKSDDRNDHTIATTTTATICV